MIGIAAYAHIMALPDSCRHHTVIIVNVLVLFFYFFPTFLFCRLRLLHTNFTVLVVGVVVIFRRFHLFVL